MSVTVATVCSHAPTQSYYYYQRAFLGSLARLGVQPVVLGLNEFWGGLCTKPKRYRHWLRQNLDSLDTVILADAWDIAFQSHPDEIEARWKELWPDLPCVFNAEKSLFPRTDLALFFPETGTPWCYLNSGFIIGKAADVLTMIESMDWDALPDDYQVKEVTTLRYNGHIPFTGSPEKTYQPDEWVHCNDQGEYQEIWSRKPVPMELDSRAELCMTGHGATLDDLDLTGGKVRNRLTDTVPGVFHGNGDCKNDLFPRLLEHWGL